VFVQAGSHGSTSNTGTIDAAQISLQAADGNVFALAGRNSQLRATGTATRDGHVWLVADRGAASAQGNIVTSNANGSAGTLDVNATSLHFDTVNVRAAQWNVTTPAYSAGPLSVAVLARTLSGGTSIAVNTTSTSGDINLLSTLRWTGNASLTLNARRSVTIGPLATVGNTGTGNLTLRADSQGNNNGGSVTNRGTIDWSHGTGVVAALFDSNGTYTGGTVKLNNAWVPAPFSGLRSQLTAYRLVNTRADLENVSNNLAGVYALGKDLDFSGSDVTFSGVGGAANAAFTGQFDGMGHAIRNVNLQVAGDSQTYLALFGVIGTKGVVRNLGVENAFANGWYSGPVAILAGLNQGLISNSHSSGTSTQSFDGSGSAGLVARNDGTIQRSSSTASVFGMDAVGGLVVVNNGRIVRSFAAGSIGGGSRSYAGGLVSTNNGTITQSYSTASASVTYAGGIAGDNSGTIIESFSTSPFNLNSFPPEGGGIALNNTGTIANNVFWNVQTTTAPQGVINGTPVPDKNGFTTAQMSVASNFGPTWDFGPTGTWVIPAGGTHPVPRWQTQP
jgi:hypothetical protein